MRSTLSNIGKKKVYCVENKVLNPIIPRALLKLNNPAPP